MTTENRQGRERSLVVYEGLPVERISPRAVMIPETNKARKRFFIAGDIIVDQYGIIGFVIGDSRPENRWVSYTDGDWVGVDYKKESEDMFGIFHKKSHYFQTDQGFKMIRYFVLPPNIREFFEADRFLGDPLIEKMCREGTLPEEFDEERASPDWVSDRRYKDDDIDEVLEAVIVSANPELSGHEKVDFSLRLGRYAFVSFHEWQDAREVFEEGQRSIIESMRNLEGIIERFDTSRRVQKKDFQIIDVTSSTRIGELKS